jgi:hypothetical protein
MRNRPRLRRPARECCSTATTNGSLIHRPLLDRQARRQERLAPRGFARTIAKPRLARASYGGRERWPHRQLHNLRGCEHGACHCVVGIGRFPGRWPAKVFLTVSSNTGSIVASWATDTAIPAPTALQHGILRSPPPHPQPRGAREGGRSSRALLNFVYAAPT